MFNIIWRYFTQITLTTHNITFYLLNAFLGNFDSVVSSFLTFLGFTQQVPKQNTLQKQRYSMVEFIRK